MINLEKFKGLTNNQKDERSKHRSVHIKKLKQLEWLVNFYPKQIETLQKRIKDLLDGKIMIRGNQKVDDLIVHIQSQIERLTDKYATVIGEIDLRKKGAYERHPIGTTYYIDLDSGNDASDGLSTGNAWLTLDKYCNVTSRTPGDIAKVRSGTNGFGPSSVDEIGTVDSLITIKGCNISDDPWSDSSDVRPIIDGDGNYVAIAYNADLSYWKLENIEINNAGSLDEGYAVFSGYSNGSLFLVNCDLSDNAGYAVYSSCFLYMENCLITNNYSGISTSGKVHLKGCVLNGNGTEGDVGIENDGGLDVFLEDCQVGETTPFGINISYYSHMLLRNCLCNTNNVYTFVNSFLQEEGINQEDGTHKLTCFNGTIEKVTNVVHSEGATSSAKVLPNEYCGLYNPIKLTPFLDNDFAVYCYASSPVTVTVYIRAIDAWSVYPTAASLYLEALYLDETTTAHRASVKSDEVISDGSTWVGFQCTFTPIQNGFAYLNLYLGKYESDKGIYVDIKPVIT